MPRAITPGAKWKDKMKAIVTKYHPASGRYSASDYDGNRVFVAGESGHGITTEMNHERAVRKLCEVMGWQGTLISGGLLGVGLVWVWRQEQLQTANEIAVGYGAGGAK